MEDFIIRVWILYLFTRMADQRIFLKLIIDIARTPLVRFSQKILWAFPPTRSTKGHDPLPPLGAEPGAPKILGQPKKSPTSGYRGSKFVPPKIDNGRAHKFWGSHFRLARGVLPPGPKNPLSRATFSWSSGRPISIKLKIYTRHTSRFSK